MNAKKTRQILDQDLASWPDTKMRFLKPALRRIHVYQLCFKINFKKKNLLLKTSAKYKLWFKLGLLPCWIVVQPNLQFSSEVRRSGARAGEIQKLGEGEDYRPKGENEIQERTDKRDSLWHYINQCNTSCWAVTQMTQMG